MRREWRNVLMAIILFPLGAGSAFARQNGPADTRASGSDLVRMTLEVTWGTPRNGVALPDRAPPADEFDARFRIFSGSRALGRSSMRCPGRLVKWHRAGQYSCFPMMSELRAPSGPGD